MTELTLTPAEIDELRRRFPAKFTPAIMETIAAEMAARMLHQANVLDVCGGPGGIHDLAHILPVSTWAIDIEPEQAACHPRNILGDSRFLPDVLAAHPEVPKPRVIIVSFAYGNRLADQYLGSDDEKCRGEGKFGCDAGWALNEDGTRFQVTVGGRGQGAQAFDQKCERCEGTGKAKSTRKGYAIALGRKLTPGSGAALAWGGPYRQIHTQLLDAMVKVDAEWWMVNISSFLKTIPGVKKPQYQPVMEWYVEEITKRMRLDGLKAIQTPRMGHGENQQSKVPVEHLIIARRP